MMKLDTYDKKLLYELDRKSNISVSKLGKKLRRSRQFIIYRLKRLEEEGLITGYNAIVDMSTLGYFTFRVYFKTQQMTDEQGKAFVKHVKENLSQVWTITTMHGDWDFALFLGVKKISEFHEIWGSIMQQYKQYIKNYNVAVYAPIYNFNRTFFMDKEQKEQPLTRIYGQGTKQEIDELDWQIIEAYASNVRISSLALAKKLSVTADTIRNRIKKLEKRQIICGYKLGLDLNKIGYAGYRVDLELVSTEKNKELFEYCKQHKNIYQINKSIGGADFETEIIVKDLNHLLEIIDELKQQFPYIINDVNYFGFSTFHILSYIPD